MDEGGLDDYIRWTEIYQFIKKYYFRLQTAIKKKKTKSSFVKNLVPNCTLLIPTLYHSTQVYPETWARPVS